MCRRTSRTTDPTRRSLIGIPLLLRDASETYVKEITCQQSGAQGNALGNVLTTTGLAQNEDAQANIGKIWALKDELDTEASYKQYKVLSVKEEENTYTV